MVHVARRAGIRKCRGPESLRDHRGGAEQHKNWRGKLGGAAIVNSKGNSRGEAAVCHAKCLHGRGSGDGWNCGTSPESNGGHEHGTTGRSETQRHRTQGRPVRSHRGGKGGPAFQKQGCNGKHHTKNRATEGTAGPRCRNAGTRGHEHRGQSKSEKKGPESTTTQDVASYECQSESPPTLRA